MMKSWHIITVFVLLTACNSSEQAQGNAVSLSEEDRETLTQMKKVSMAKAYDEQDTVLLDQLLHEKYRLVDDGGLTYSKKDEMTYVSKYASSYDSLYFEIKSLEIFDNGTATLFGEGTITGTDLGGPYTLSYKSTDVFVKEGDEWKVITSHVSGTKEVRPNEDDR